MADENKQKNKNKKEIDLKLDLLERKIEELRVMYEQFFIDVNPHIPDKLHKDVKRQINNLLNAPFKSSQRKFRLKNLVTRFQTYATYWERVMKQREEGTYSRDVFKAEMREKMLEEERRAMTEAGIAEKGLKQLFSTYEKALKKTGSKIDNLDYSAFRKRMIQQAKTLKQKHGAKQLTYKVVLSKGRATIKASVKKK